jgi:hypothetical protein
MSRRVHRHHIIDCPSVPPNVFLHRIARYRYFFRFFLQSTALIVPLEGIHDIFRNFLFFDFYREGLQVPLSSVTVVERLPDIL